MRFFIYSFFLISFMGLSFAQDICYQSFPEPSYLINFEGRFVNSENSRSLIDVSWKHHENAPDSFQVYLSSTRSYLFITTNDYRVLWIQPENVKRQMATHHLKEKIGKTPIHWDDLDLLANGSFFCQDSNTKAKFIFATAYSQTWYSLVFDTLPSPSKIKMRGARGLSREITIHSWKNLNGISLPTILKFKGPDYSGSLWIRSTHSLNNSELTDPLLKNVHEKKGKLNTILFPRTERKRKMPLILQMDKELLQ